MIAAGHALLQGSMFFGWRLLAINRTDAMVAGSFFKRT
jgi:hypothetical protein